MDDIATIQRINNMSQQLKNFGFYDTQEDSVNGATKMILSEEQQQGSKVFAETQLVEEMVQSFKRYKEVNDRRISLLASEISKLNSQLKNISEQHPPRSTIIRNDSVPVLRSDEPIPNPSTQPKPAPVQQEIPREKEINPETPKTEERPYNQRQGKFTSEDVKIEDIFYFGQKR